jgi:transcriptional regulator with XRE-family HTH domain
MVPSTPRSSRPTVDKSKATIVRVGNRPAALHHELDPGPGPEPVVIRSDEAGVRPAVDGVGEHVGAAIRSRRKALGRTMQDVAREADLSQPFLSQIERGQALPSMRSLDRIALALGTSGISLLSGARSGATVDLIRPDERASLVQNAADPSSAATALTPANRHLRVIEFDGGWREFQQYSVHHNDEMVVVLEGRYVADVDGETFDLGPGDAISYAGGVPHRYRLVGDGPHRFLAVIVPDEFDVVARSSGFLNHQ